MTAFGDRCVELRKQGYTLSQIAKTTKRPKTSVYYNIRSFPLSNKKWAEIRAAHGARIRIFALQRKGKSTRSFRKFYSWDADTVSLVSHLIFDGDIREGCSYNNRNTALIKHVERTMRKIYNYEPRRYQNKATGVHRISYFNVALAAYLRGKGEVLLKDILRLPRSLKRVFLRSFFDDEGCMDFRPYRNFRSIRGYQNEKEILMIVQFLLSDFKIESSVKKPNEVAIVGKSNLSKFQKEINFSRGVRINGNRSNSIWKKPLEKRELLQRAINSYKPIGSNGVHRLRAS